MLLRYIDQYFRDIYMLFSSDVLKNKTYMYFLYNYLCIKNIISKIFGIKFKSQRFLGFVCYFENFNSFFGTFTEIFIYNIYYFKTDHKSPIVVDCGANIGLSILYFKHIYPSATIECYEPDISSFKILRKNVEINLLKNTKIINKAISDFNGKTKFYTFEGVEGCTGNTTEKDHANFDKMVSYDVDVIKLSDMKYDRIDFLKMDIEGGEGKVFSDFDQNDFFEKVNSIGLEYHYKHGSKDNFLSGILHGLERNNYNIIINVNILLKPYVSSSFYERADKKYVLMINAYK